jgi:ribosome-binding protein aMBF1 (putative translation factor)
MLLKVTAMDDPKDMPGVEKAVRVAAAIERIYSRCDRAERQIRDKVPDPRKLEAERATNETEAIKARVSLANTLKWGEERRRDLGPWWDAAQNVTKAQTQAPATPRKASETPAPQGKIIPEPPMPVAGNRPSTGPKTPNVTYVDYTDSIIEARAALGLKPIPEAEMAEAARKWPPPLDPALPLPALILSG